MMSVRDIEMINSFGDKLAELMKGSKLSISEVADKTGLSYAEIRNIKDKNLKKIDPYKIVRISNYFHINPAYLLGVEYLPDDLNIGVKSIEFQSSFYERETTDFFYDNKCDISDEYEPEYEEAVYNVIHSYVEIHKMSTGYYCSDYDDSRIKPLSPKDLEKKFRDYVIDTWESLFDGDKREYSKSCLAPASSDDVISVGKAIVKMRDVYKLTRKELAERAGLSEDTLFRIERGLNKKINSEHIDRISRELRCTSDFLLGRSCDPTANESGFACLYEVENSFVYRRVQVGHDLSYANTHMDSHSLKLLVEMIRQIDRLFNFKIMSCNLFGESLSLQDVYFREQAMYKEKYKNRGAHFYFDHYKVLEGGREADGYKEAERESPFR